jgi:hypothetical protein
MYKAKLKGMTLPVAKMIPQKKSDRKAALRDRVIPLSSLTNLVNFCRLMLSKCFNSIQVALVLTKSRIFD